MVGTLNMQAAKVPVKELEFNEKKLLNVRSALVIVLIQSFLCVNNFPFVNWMRCDKSIVYCSCPAGEVCCQRL